MLLSVPCNHTVYTCITMHNYAKIVSSYHIIKVEQNATNFSLVQSCNYTIVNRIIIIVHGVCGKTVKGARVSFFIPHSNISHAVFCSRKLLSAIIGSLSSSPLHTLHTNHYDNINDNNCCLYLQKCFHCFLIRQVWSFCEKQCVQVTAVDIYNTCTGINMSCTCLYKRLLYI